MGSAVARRKKRIAAIDIGTNSVHMIVAEEQGRSHRVIDKEKEMVQLGRGSLDGAPLTEDSMNRAAGALVRMAEIARYLNVDQIIAVATSAMREAPNAHLFIDRVAEETGIQIEVISGEREADLIFSAVRAGVDFHGGAALLIDIGGGSVEIVLGKVDETFFVDSLPLGSLRLSQKYFAGNGSVGNKAVARCRRFVRKRLKKTFSDLHRLDFDMVLGTSGTILALAGLAASDGGEVAQDDLSASLRWLDARELSELIDDLCLFSTAERAKVYRLDTRRAETIIAGAILLDEFLREMRVERMLACNAALREGIVIQQFSGRTSSRPQDGSVRRGAVIALAEKSGFDRRHSLHVAKLATRIFDQTTELHGLGAPEREILEYAALLHEIGLHVSYQRHHKHTYYLIRHSGLDGFTDEQISVLANVARYHRKATPNDNHLNFLELTAKQRDVVRRLAAILRMAEGLDRNRRQAIRDVMIEAGSRRLVISVVPRLDPSLEIEYAEKGATHFGELFGRKVRFEILPVPEKKAITRPVTPLPGPRPESGNDWIH